MAKPGWASGVPQIAVDRHGVVGVAASGMGVATGAEIRGGAFTISTSMLVGACGGGIGLTGVQNSSATSSRACRPSDAAGGRGSVRHPVVLPVCASAYKGDPGPA